MNAATWSVLIFIAGWLLIGTAICLGKYLEHRHG